MSVSPAGRSTPRGARWQRASEHSRASTPTATSRGSIERPVPGSRSTPGSARRFRPRCALERTRSGRFDPTILPALTAAGYDRSFELLTERAAMPLDGWHAGAHIDVDPGADVRASSELPQSTSAASARDSPRHARSRRCAAPGPASPERSSIWAATSPSGARLPRAGRGAWTSQTRGRPAAWSDTLALASGGVATSGRDTRRFGPGGRLHHLIDPATGAPAVAGPLSVTVVAASATEAEAYATALAVSDVDDGTRPDWPRDPTSERCSSPTPASRSSSAAFL